MTQKQNGDLKKEELYTVMFGGGVEERPTQSVRTLLVDWTLTTTQEPMQK